MKVEMVRELMDYMEIAGHFTDHFPVLPEGLHGRHIRVLDKVAVKNLTGVRPLPSDVSEMLCLARPGVTRTLNELEQQGYISKTVDVKDNRMYRLNITEEGWKLYDRYVNKTCEAVRLALDGMDEEVIREAIATLKEAENRVNRMAERKWKVKPV